MRIYTQAKKVDKATKHFQSLIDTLAAYDLIDIMIAFADQHGGTTPLYEAVEEAQDEIDEGSVYLITDKGRKRIR